MAGEKAPIYLEFATIARTALWGQYDHLLRPEDDTLLTRGQGKGLRLYDEIERDPKVFEVLQKRTLALLSREWKVEPASPSRIDKKAADLVRSQLANVGFDALTRDLLDSTMKGISFEELMWQRDGAEIVLGEALHRKPWWFTFIDNPEVDDNIFARAGHRMLTVENPLYGIKVPQKKFLVHRFMPKYNSPWGIGLGSKLFWPVFFKRQGIQFWLSFAERFGTPVPVGKYPQNAMPNERATLKAALRAFTQEGAIMVPEGMDITLLEAARSGIDTYEKLCRYMDDASAGIVLGKPSGGGTGGQLAAAVNVENEVRLELVKGDADLISDTLNRQVVRWMVDYNYPGAGYPKVTRDVSDPVDTVALAATRKTICDMGYRPTLAQIVEDFGGEYIDIGLAPPKTDPVGDPAATASPPSADFALPDDATPDQVALDAFVKAIVADPAMQKAAAAVLRPIFDAVKRAKDGPDALELLVALLPNIPMDTLQDALARMMFVSEMWGRLTTELPDAGS